MKKTNPLVSIVIPVFNDKENYLAELIESIDKQSYTNFEVIIVDDASINAEHIERLRKLSDEVKKYPLKIYIQSKNTGPAGALNKAIENSKGSYIKYCSHDDILFENSIEEMVNYFIRNPKTEIMFTDIEAFGSVFGRWNGIYGYGTAVKKDLSDISFLKLFTHEIFMGGPFPLIHKTVFNKIGNFDTSVGVEDWDFFLRALDDNIIVKYYEKVLYKYRKHDNSLSKNAIYNLKSRYLVVIKYQMRPDLKKEVADHYVAILLQLMSLSKKEFWNVFVSIATDKELGSLYIPKLMIRYPSFIPSLFFRFFVDQDSQLFKKIKKQLKK